MPAGEGGCQASCTGRCILSALTPKLFCFFSPPLLSVLVFPFLLPLSPAAMNPLLKSCLTHQDLPTSPRCLARRPAWLIPCSRNCPVPADAGSRAPVPCSTATRALVCRSGQVGTGPGSPWPKLSLFPALSVGRGWSCCCAAVGRLLSHSERGDWEGQKDLTSQTLSFLLGAAFPFPQPEPWGHCWRGFAARGVRPWEGTLLLVSLQFPC